jgi:hypothetical protein
LEPYFFSSGFDSLGEEGIGVDGEVLLELAPPLPELEAPPLDMPPLLVDPDALESAPGAGVGVGVVDDDEEEGALGAGAGVTTFSSFLQAVKPSARRAAKRSERFMFFPLGDVTRVRKMRKRSVANLPLRAVYPIVMNILPASPYIVLTSSLHERVTDRPRLQECTG